MSAGDIQEFIMSGDKLYTDLLRYIKKGGVDPSADRYVKMKFNDVLECKNMVYVTDYTSSTYKNAIKEADGTFGSHLHHTEVFDFVNQKHGWDSAQAVTKLRKDVIETARPVRRYQYVMQNFFPELLKMTKNRNAITLLAVAAAGLISATQLPKWFGGKSDTA